MKVIVHKFGGTSLNDGVCIANAAKQVLASHEAGAQCVVVVSAMGGLTDRLIGAARDAAKGKKDAVRAVASEIRARHAEALLRLTDDRIAAEEARAVIEKQASEFETLCQGIKALRELSPRTLDSIAARGEWISAILFALALRSAGVKSTAVHAKSVIITDANFGSAAPDPIETRKRAHKVLVSLLRKKAIPVVTGFIGATPEGEVTTLGRGGSDYSAAILGSALDADEVQIWTDVNGVFTADPRAVLSARVIEQLNYREASELSYYGAKVLHPRTIIPVAARKIPLRIRNTFAPALSGTVVDDKITLSTYPVKAVTAISRQSLVTVEGRGMLGVPGVAARVFSAMAEEKASVTMISQSSSENNICFTIPTESADAAVRRLRKSFAAELERGDIESIRAQALIAIVAVVGAGMKGTPGIAARIFGALAKQKINVVAIAQGSSELNVSFVVEAKAADKAVRVVHEEFGLDRLDTHRTDEHRSYDLILVGVGQIARSFLTQLRAQKYYFQNRLGIDFNLVELIDSTGFVSAPDGLKDAEVDSILEAKAKGKGLKDFRSGHKLKSPADAVREIGRYRLSRPIILDLSDGEDTIEALRAGIDVGCHVVLSNKKPIAGAWDVYEGLQRAALNAEKEVLFEATVGAGLPILDTLRKLSETGDRVLRVEGCLSGTLGYVLTAMEQGARLSEAVAEAARLGFTEPDPLEDLSGRDVARKAVILSRLTGHRTEASDVLLEPLLPSSFEVPRGKNFFEALDAFDDEYASRIASARSKGEVLRYSATISGNEVTVGTTSFSAQSPFAGLKGTDNQVAFTTVRYRKQPLVVRGPGAGAEVTAAGVLADVLRITSLR